MLIQAALNGSRSKAQHPLIPVSSSELADAALGAATAGAGAIHFHARGKHGHETLIAEQVGENLKAIRSKVKDLPVGVSTGAWIIADPETRHSTIASWAVLPDFASVNFHEKGATELAQMFLDRGVGVEAGLSNLTAVREFVASGLASQCLRVLIEPQEASFDAALQTATAIQATLDDADVRLQTVLHGVDGTAWELMNEAIRRGHSVRIGFEDTLNLPDGRIAHDNAELVREVWARIEASQRR